MTIPKRHTNQYNQRVRRVRKIVTGSNTRPRLVVFCGSRSNQVQLIDDQNQKTLASANDLKEKTRGNVESAKKVGQLIAENAKKQNIKEAVLDRRGRKYHGRVKAIAESAREAGLKI